MADVAIVVDSDAAGVDVYRRRFKGNELFLEAAEGIVEMDGHSIYDNHIFSRACGKICCLGFVLFSFIFQLRYSFLQLFYILHEGVKDMRMVKADFYFLTVLLGDPARDTNDC